MSQEGFAFPEPADDTSSAVKEARDLRRSPPRHFLCKGRKTGWQTGVKTSGSQADDGSVSPGSAGSSYVGLDASVDGLRDPISSRRVLQPDGAGLLHPTSPKEPASLPPALRDITTREEGLAETRLGLRSTGFAGRSGLGASWREGDTSLLRISASPLFRYGSADGDRPPTLGGLCGMWRGSCFVSLLTDFAGRGRSPRLRRVVLRRWRRDGGVPPGLVRRGSRL